MVVLAYFKQRTLLNVSILSCDLRCGSLLLLATAAAAAAVLPGAVVHTHTQKIRTWIICTSKKSILSY